MLLILALLSIAQCQNTNGTNEIESNISAYLSDVVETADSFSDGIGVYSSSTVASNDPNTSMAHKLSADLMAIAGMLRSSQNGIVVDQDALGDALTALSNLFIGLCYFRPSYGPELSYALPNLVNNALVIVSDFAGHTNFQCTDLETMMPVASLYEAVYYLNAAWSFPALVNTDLAEFCSLVSLTSVDIDVPHGSGGTIPTGDSSLTTLDSSSDATSTHESKSKNVGKVLFPNFEFLALALI